MVDGEVLDADGLELDESLLTGEADPVPKHRGTRCSRAASWSRAPDGHAHVWARGYAVALAAEARRFTLVHSEIRDAPNRVLQVITWALVPTGVLLFTTQLLLEQATSARRCAARSPESSAWCPKGLVLLTSVAFAVGVVRLGARGARRGAAERSRGSRGSTWWGSTRPAPSPKAR